MFYVVEVPWYNLWAPFTASTSIYDMNLKDAAEITLDKFGDFRNFIS